MPNIMTYIGNVGKSITYSAVDQVKELNPAVAELIDSNKDLAKIAYESVKDYKGTMKKAKDYVIQSDVGEAAIQMKKSILEDLKTGRFYNRQRIDEMDIKASGGLLDFSDMGDPFDSMDDDSSWNMDDDFNEDDWNASLDDQYLAESMDATGEKITQGVAEATFRSADYIVGANKQNLMKMQKHNEFLVSKVNANISAVSAGISQLVTFNDQNMSTHINNSQKFYDFATNNMSKQLELLEAIAKNTAVGSYTVDPKKQSDKVTYNDIIGAEGMPDLKEYFKMVKGNIDDITGGLSNLNKSMGGNMLMTLAGSPLKVVTDTLVKKVIPDTAKTLTKSLNESLSGVFSSLMMKAEYAKDNSDNELMSKLGQILGVNMNIKGSINTSKYNRGPIPFDGETKTAILNMSQQMSKIISLMSGKSERVFDYSTGKWTTFEDINSTYGVDKATKRSAQSASSELRSIIDEMTSRTDFVSAEDRKKFKDSLDAMFLNAYQNGGLFGFNGKDFHEFARRMGIDYDSVKYIKPIMDQLEKEYRSKLLTYNNNIYRQRQSQNNRMKTAEESPSSVERILYNGYLGDEFVNRDKKGKVITNPYDIKNKDNKNPMMMNGFNLITTRDNKGKNVFDYLQKTIYELEYIRRNGLPGGNGGNGMYLPGPYNTSTGTRAIIEPEPFQDESYMRANKNKDERDRKERLDDQKAYDRERSKWYERFERERAKGNYRNPIFNAVEDFDVLGLDRTEEDEIRAYRQYLQGRSDLKHIDEMRIRNTQRQKKIDKMPGWIKVFLDSDNVDDRVKTFMTGINDLSQKPAEFLARMVDRTDKALYNAIYGDEKEDRLTTKTFMGQLIARMTSTFANFGDFLKDDILNPLQAELFGEDSVTTGIVKKAKDKLNIDTENLNKSIKEFVLGRYELDENGNRVLDSNGNPIMTNAGMFGSKVNYIKKNMKDVYRTPIQYLKGTAKDPERLAQLRAENEMIKIRNKEAEQVASNSIFRFIDNKYVDENGNIDPRIFEKRNKFFSSAQGQYRLTSELTRDEVNERTAALKERLKAKYKPINGDDIEQHYTGGFVKKTGVAAVSEGELIIPSELNPFYNETKTKAQQRAKEISAKKDFIKYINGLGKTTDSPISGYNTGGTATGLATVVDMRSVRESRTKSNKKQVKSSNQDDAAAAASDKPFWQKIEGDSYDYKQKLHNLRDEYITGEESIGYKLGDEVNNLFGFFSSIGINKKNIKERLSKSSETFAAAAEKIARQMEDATANGQDSQALYENMVSDVKGDFSKYFPSLLGGGLVGAGVSLVTGAVGGPLLGAAIGSATDLVVSSGAVQNWLFGEIGEDGKRRGNVLSKDLSNNITKYFPDMAKGAVVGGITSILPFVPGGPVAGIILGSSIGFAKNNDKIQKYLFGDEDSEGLISKRTQETIKKAVPAAILGGGIGAFVGPLGLVGNIAVGSAIGFAAKTHAFNEFLFGKEDENGEKEGGVVNSIKNGFIDPLIDFGGSLIDRVHTWFKDDIADPFVSSILPNTTEIKNIVGKVLSAITGKVSDVIDREMTSLKVPFATMLNERFLKPLAGLGKGALNAAAYPAGKIISSPFRFMGMIGDINRSKHVAHGDANYMTAAERLRYREEVSNGVQYQRYTQDERDEDGNLIHRKGEFVLDENGEPIVRKKRAFGILNDLTTGRRARKDHFREFDEMLVNTDIDSLKEMSNAIDYLQNPNKAAKRQKLSSAQSIKHALTGKVPYNIQRSILDSMDNGNFEEAMETLRRSGMEPSEMRKVTQLLTQEYSNYETANQLMNDEGKSRNRVYASLKRLGLKDISDRTLGKYKGLLDQEINNKPDEKSEIEKLNENQDNRHSEIVDLFRSVIDELRAIRDPKYAEEIATKKFQRNMYEARKRRGLFRFTDSGDSGLFGQFEYKAMMGEDGKLHYYRIDKDGNQQLVDEKGRVIDEEGNFVDDASDIYEDYYDNNPSAGNTGGRNALNTAQGGVLGALHTVSGWGRSAGRFVGGVARRSWNGATYEERLELQNAKNIRKQEYWKKKLIQAGIAIPENYTGSYKDLWMIHFSGRRNLRQPDDIDDENVRYVSDSDGNPIRWVRTENDEWQIDNRDSETRNYLSAREKAAGMWQGVKDTLGGLTSTVKNGFENLFNIDKERDGWLKRTAKIGVGILGALTVAGFCPILEKWFKNTAAPAVGAFWKDKIAPKLGKLIEPIKPTIARAAAGVDSVIRSIPNALDTLGNKITTFFKFTFPDLLTNKIIPFYKNGIDWLVDKTGWIAEKATNLAFQIMPRVIVGAIKGAWQFMKNDIFTLFGGYGRRDAKSLLSMTTKVSGTNSKPVENSNIGKKMSNFSLFSDLYRDATGETPQQTLGIKNPSTKELENYYNGKSSSLPEIRYSTLDSGSKSSQSFVSAKNTTKSSSNSYVPFSGNYDPSSYENYAASVGSSYGSNTLNSAIVNDYNRSISNTNNYGNYDNTSTIANWNRTSIQNANAPYVANNYSNGYNTFGPTSEPQLVTIPNADQIINDNQYYVDENNNVYDTSTGSPIGFFDAMNNTLSFMNNSQYKSANNSVFNLLDNNNQSIATKLIGASSRAFLQGSGSALTRGLSNFGKHSFLMNRTLPGKIFRRTINAGGNIIEGAGHAGGSIQRVLGNRVVASSYDNMAEALLSGSGRNVVQGQYNNLVREALDAGFNPEEAAEWARNTIKDDDVLASMYNSAYKNADDVVARFAPEATRDGIRSAKDFAVHSIDDIAEDVARSTSQEAAERVISGVSNATTHTGIIKTLTNKLKSFFEFLTRDGMIKRYFKKALQASGQSVTDDAVEAGLKTLTREGEEALISTFGNIATKSGTKLLKVLGEWLPFVGIAFSIKDFYDGFTKGAAWLGITDDQCPVWAKFACGLAQVLNGKFTLGLIPISVLVDLFVGVLAPMFSIDMEDFNELRNEAGRELDEFNEKNKTNLTLEQYNNRHNFISRAWERTKSIFTGSYLYDNLREIDARAESSERSRQIAINAQNKTYSDTSFSRAVGAGSGIASRYSSMIGKGDDKTLICQNNPAYAKLRFNSKADTKYQTLEDSGCGPAAAAMVINAINDSNIDIKDAANFAIQDGTKVKDSGVDARYFNDYYSQNGIKAQYTDGASSIIDMLKSTKNPVVLLGQDLHNTSKMYSPFGAGDHYVVANKVSGNTIYINDPEQPKANIPYNISILNKVKMGIGAVQSTKGVKVSVPTKYNNYNGAGNGMSLPRVALRRNKSNRLRSLSYLSGRGSSDDFNIVSHQGMQQYQYDNIQRYKNSQAVNAEEYIDESRSPYSINEVINSIMVLQSSQNIATINLNGDGKKNIAIGIMQWAGTEAGRVLYAIMMKNQNSAKSILGESSTVYKRIKNKSAIASTDLTTNGRNRLTTFLSSSESRDVQLTEAKALAMELSNKSPFTNAKSTIMWAAIYNYNKDIANELSGMIGGTLDKSCSVSSLYEALKLCSGYSDNQQKFAMLYSYVQSSPCTEISTKFDTAVLSQTVSVNEEDDITENNFLSQIFEKITEIGKAFFGITTGRAKKESLFNTDSSLGDQYAEISEVFNIDPDISDALHPMVNDLNNKEKTLDERMKVLSKMISIDRFAAITFFESTDLYDYLSELNFFNNYNNYGVSNEDSTILSNKVAFLNPDSIVKSVKEECLNELNRYDYSISRDLEIGNNESFESSTIHGLFEMQIKYFEAIGSAKDANNVKYAVSKKSSTSIVKYDKVSENSCGSGAFDNDFFKYRLMNNRNFIASIKKLSSRVDIIEFLDKYLKDDLLRALNNGDFFSEMDVTRSELRDALSILCSDEYSLDAKEKAWDAAEAILNTGFVNNPNVSKDQLLKILNEYNTHDFDYMKDSKYKVNTTTNSNTARNYTGMVGSTINALQYLNNKNKDVSVVGTKKNSDVLSNVFNVLGNASITKNLMPNQIGTVLFGNSSNSLNPYTAKRIKLANDIKELGKRNMDSLPSENTLSSFENMAKLRWLYKTNQGASKSDLEHLSSLKIKHPYGARIDTKEYDEIRDNLALLMALPTDSNSLRRGNTIGSLMSALKSNNYGDTDWYSDWLSYYNLWKSQPSSVGGPFINGYKFNKMEWMKSRLAESKNQNSMSLANAADLQELIANEILGQTDQYYTKDNSPISKYYSELEEYIGMNKDENKATSKQYTNMPDSVFKDYISKTDPETATKSLLDIGNSYINYSKTSSLLGLPAAKGSFVSQYDYGNKTFSDGESLSTSGCGPAVASMILGSAGNSTPLMDYAASVANRYKNDGGTNAAYFNDILGRAGMSTQYIQNNIKSGIENSLSAGQQVVVMGNDSNNNSKSNSPFGPGNHYVLATGMKNGKVAINDPEQSGPRVYSNSILKNAKLGVAVGRGSGILNKFSAKGSWDASQLKNQDLKMYGANSITAEQLNNFVKSKYPNSFWASKGNMIIKASQITGLDPRYLLAHAIVEAGWNPSRIAIDKHNFFGIGAIDSDPYNGAYSWDNDEDGFIKGAMWIEENYYKRGQTTIYKMRYNGGSHQYCTSNTWVDTISNIWSQMPASLVGPNQNVGGTGYYNNSDGSESWLDRISNGIERAGKAYFGISYGSSNNSYSSSSPVASSIVDEARKYIGVTPYKYGGTDLQTGADCSGFTQSIFRLFGANIPRTANSQYTNQSVRSVKADSLQPGDLVFFNYDGGKNAKHVGIYSGDNKFIHSPQDGEKVKESTLNINASSYLGARRYTIPSASGSNILQRVDNFVSGKGSYNSGKQKLAYALSNIKNNNAPIKVSNNSNKVISTDSIISSINQKMQPIAQVVKSNISGSGSGTLDSNLIYESLATIIKLLDQTATNTSYTKKVEELVEIASKYLQSIGDKSAKGSSTTNTKQTTSTRKSKAPSKNYLGSYMAGSHSSDEMNKLQNIINQFKGLISN